MNLREPIPLLKSNENWENVKISENNEPLVNLSKTNGAQGFIFKPRYFLDNIKGSIEEIFVREGVYHRLLQASKLLPKGYKLVIFDGWRPFEVQKTLFNQYLEDIKHKNPTLDEIDLIKLTKKFVSYPSDNILCPSPHFTGGAIDITIADEDMKCLFMGTEFDDFTDKALTVYLEEKLTKEGKLCESDMLALNNRRALYNIMLEVGFTNYSNEWWHYDYGNQFWGTQVNTNAIYGITNMDKK